MKYCRVLLLVLGLCVIVSNVAFSQIHILCPLPNAIIQKISDSASLRILFNSNETKRINLRIIDSLGNDIPNYSWNKFSFQKNILDTILIIPIHKKFAIQWRTVDGQIDSGVIPNLSVGHVFGITGQSNAQGWSYPDFISPQGSIRMLLNDSAWQKGEDPTGGKWASPWIQFANRLQDLVKDSLPIGLVNVAVGGTGLVNKTDAGWWQRNDAFHTDPSSVYGKALIRFLSAGSHFEAIFWIQGESDAVGVTGEQYISAFKKLIENFEEDLHHTLQFFHLQIGGQNGNPDKYSWGRIRNAQRNLPRSTLVGTAVGSPVGFDNIHYAKITEIMVGDRFAGTIAKLLHNVPNNLFPPLLPQNSADLIACTSQDPYKGYKIVLQCMRGGVTLHN